MNTMPRTASENGSPPKRTPSLKELLDPDEWDEFNRWNEFNRKLKVLKFRDGADVFVAPESEVESIGSFSPDGATLTLKSGQEVTVDRRAGVESVEVASVEEMIKLVVNKEKKPTVLPLTEVIRYDKLHSRKDRICKGNKKFKSGTCSADLSSSPPRGSRKAQTGSGGGPIAVCVPADARSSPQEPCSSPGVSNPVAAGGETG